LVSGEAGCEPEGASEGTTRAEAGLSVRLV